VEKGRFFGDKNDPYVKLKYDDQPQMVTDAIDSGGSDVTWALQDLHEMNFRAKAEGLKTKTLHVEVWDKNNKNPDVVIGTSRVGMKLAKVIGCKEGFTVTEQVSLDKDGKAAGYVEIEFGVSKLRYAEKDSVKPDVAKVPDANPINYAAAAVGSSDTSTVDAPTVESASGSAQPSTPVVKKENVGPESNSQATILDPVDPQPQPQPPKGAPQREPSPRFSSAKAAPKPTPTSISAADGSQEVKRFKSAQLQIHEVRANNLPNVERMIGDKNDPYCKLQLGEWCFQTDVKDSAGANASWLTHSNQKARYENLTFEQLQGEVLLLECWEHNNRSEHVLFGRVRFPLNELLKGDYTKKDFRIELAEQPLTGGQTKKKNKKGGFGDASITLALKNFVFEGDDADTQPKNVESVGSLSEGPSAGDEAAPVQKSSATDTTDSQVAQRRLGDHEKGTLRLLKVAANGLKNVERLGGHNDPFCRVHFRGNTIYESPHIPEGGSAVQWDLSKQTDLEKTRMPVTRADLDSLELEIEVWDHNDFFAHKAIGSGKVPLTPFVDSFLGQTITLPPVVLKDKKGKETGTASLSLALAFKDLKGLSAVASAGAQDETSSSLGGRVVDSCKLRVQKIICSDLKDVERSGHNDVYVKMALNGRDEITTEVAEDAGKRAEFDLLDYNWDLQIDELTSGKLSFLVMEHNTFLSDKFIGQNTASLRGVKGMEFGVPFPISVDLQGKDKSGKTGHVTIVCIALEQTKPTPVALPADFSGKVQVSAIRLLDYYDSNDKSKKSAANYKCELSSSDWNVSTAELPGSYPAMRNAAWIDQHIDIPVFLATLQNGKLGMKIKTSKEKAVCQGEALFSSAVFELNKEAILTVKMKVPGKPLCRALVFCKLAEKQQDEIDEERYQVPAGFDKGVATIDKIVVHNLRHLETWGGKNDPFVVVRFGENKPQETNVLKDHGSDGSWDPHFRFPVTAETLHDHCDVAVMEWNLSGNKKHGSARFTFLRAAAASGQTVEVPLKLDKTEQGQETGDVVLYMTVREVSDPQSFTLPDTFDKGTLNLRDLKVIGLQEDVIVDMIFNGVPQKLDSSNQAQAKLNYWDHLEDKFYQVSRESASGNLEITVSVGGVLYGTNKLGSGAAPIIEACAKFGQEVQMVIPIEGAKDVSVVIHATCGPQHLVTDDHDEEELVLPESFQEGVLFISEMQGQKLKNVERGFDKNDPFAQLHFGEWHGQTDILENGGSNVAWPNNFKVDITRAQLEANEKLHVRILDDNHFTKDKLIGGVEVSLRTAANLLSTRCPVVEQLSGASGNLLMILEIRPFEEGELGHLPEDFTAGVLSISKAVGTNMKNTESLKITGDLPDPYLILKMGGFEDRTSTKDNTCDPVWDSIIMKIPVTREELENGTLTVMAKDDNRGFDKLIGTDTLRLNRVTELDTDKELNVKLLDDANDPAGFVALTVRLELAPETLIDVTNDYTSGHILIDKVYSKDMKKGFFDWFAKSIVRLSLADSTPLTTRTLSNTGGSQVWDCAGLTFDVTKDQLVGDEQLKVELIDGNKKNPKVKGSGTVGVNHVGSALDTSTTLLCDLVDSKGKPAGTIALDCKLHNFVKEEDLRLDPTFQFGVVSIKKIAAKGLRNVELIPFDKNDPYVNLKFSDWEAETPHKNGAGADCVWKDMFHEIEVYPETLRDEKLKLECWDKNVGKPQLIGTAELSLLRAAVPENQGTEIPLPVQLMGPKGEEAGTLTVYARTGVPKDTNTLPLDFSKGVLHVRTIAGLGLKNTEWFGKQDPYCELKLKNDEFKTAANKKGSDVVWKDLTFASDVTLEDVKGAEFEVVMKDSNWTRGDALIGKANVRINRCSTRFGKEVDISGVLHDENDKPSGRVVLTVQLEMAEVVPELTLNLPDSFLVGNICVSDISIMNLVHEEKESRYLIKSKVFVWLKMGQHRARTRTNEKGMLNWDERELKLQVNRELLESETDNCILVSVCKDGSKDSFVSGKVDVRDLVNSMDINAPLKLKSSPLVDNEGSIVAYISLTAQLREGALEDSADMIPSSMIKQEFAILSVEKCDLDMVGTDGSTCFCKVTVDDESLRTPLSGGAPSSSWPVQGMEFEVTNDQLKFKKMSVAVYALDGVKEREVGVASVSLKRFGIKPDTSQDVDMEVVEADGSVLGFVKLTVNNRSLIIPDEADMGKGLFVVKISDVEVRVDNNSRIKKDQPLQAVFNMGQHDQQMVEVTNGVKSSGTIEMKKVPFTIAKDASIDVLVHKSPTDEVDSTTFNLLEALSKVGKPNKVVKYSKNGNTQLSCTCTIEKAKVAAPSKGDEAVPHEIPRNDPPTAEAFDSEPLESKMKQLEREMNRLLAQQKRDAKEKFRLSGLTKVENPKNVKEWRSTHVQAWLAHEQDLTRYLPIFKEASIDGKVLLKYINEDTLANTLKIGIDLHRKKIVENINELKARQLEWEKAEARKREKALELEAQREKERLEREKQRAKEEAEALARRNKEKEDRLRREKNRTERRKKKKKKREPAVKATIVDSGETRGKTAMRVEMEVKRQRELNKKREEAAQKKKAYYRFLYNGEHPDEDLNGLTLPAAHAYEAAMTQISELVLSEKEETEANNIPPLDLRLVHMNPKMSTDECIVEIKKRMFDLSSRLIALQQRRDEKEARENSDMLEMTDLSALPTDISNMPFQSMIPETTDAMDDEDDASYHEPGNNDEELDAASYHSPPEMLEIEIPSRKVPVPTVAWDNERRYDRVGLVFEAFLNLVNNAGRKDSSHLTYLKFQGGVESVLRLKFNSVQIMTMWDRLNKTDTSATMKKERTLQVERNQYLDEIEFKEFFGDLSEFESSAEIVSLYFNPKDLAVIKQFAASLEEMCNVFRSNKFSVIEVYRCFDQNGQGNISPSEFVKMMRLVLGTHVDRKLINLSLNLIDANGDKTISIQELLSFMYRIWMHQLLELKEAYHSLDSGRSADKMRKIKAEIEDIASAIDLNFPRAWRDDFKRRVQAGKSNGPLERMLEHIHQAKHGGKQNFTLTTLEQIRSPAANNMSPSRSPSHSSGASKYSNSLLGSRVKNLTNTIPTRNGREASLPPIKDIGGNDILTSSRTEILLRKNEFNTVYGSV
jgi:hypothetical protein